MPRTYLHEYDRPVMVSNCAIYNLRDARVNLAFTGVMELTMGVIDLCAAAAGNPHYPTEDPGYQQYVGNQPVDPIVHDPNGKTSHDALAEHVSLHRLGIPSDEYNRNMFCGFTVRLNDDNNAALSATSRTLNSGTGFTNGQLEPVLKRVIKIAVGRHLTIYGWTDYDWVAARTNPHAAAAARNPNAHPGAFRPPGFAAMIQQAKKN
ncbi:MAG: hypothetical protein AAGB12_10240 [Pseudomonadota bacterium]